MPYWILIPSGVFKVTMRLRNMVAANKAGASKILNLCKGISSNSPNLNYLASKASSFSVSVQKLRIPSANFSVAIASLFN